MFNKRFIVTEINEENSTNEVFQPPLKKLKLSYVKGNDSQTKCNDLLLTKLVAFIYNTPNAESKRTYSDESV